MPEFRTIMVAIDFSAAAMAALRTAADLGARLGAALIVVHVEQVHAASVSDASAADADGAGEVASDGLERACERFARENIGTGVRFETAVCQGDAAFEIVRAAGEAKADLLVIGSHGRTGLRHLIMGSVAGEVVRRAPLPVLVIKPA